jgi:hypothetical protein
MSHLELPFGLAKVHDGQDQVEFDPAFFNWNLGSLAVGVIAADGVEGENEGYDVGTLG